MDEIGEALDAARSVLKSHLKQTRNVLQFLSELDEQLDALATRRTAEEAQRNGTKTEGTGTPERFAAR